MCSAVMTVLLLLLY